MTQPDNRSAQRVMTVYKAARIGTEQGDDLGLIRNISPQGMMVETQLPVREDQPVIIEIQSGSPLHGRVRWSRDGKAGVQLDDAIDLAEALRTSGPNDIVDRIRPPRFDRKVDATLQSGGYHWPATTRNISLSGALVTTREPLALQPHVLALVRIDGLGAISGSLRWSRGCDIGLRFEHPLPLRQFQRWLHQSQDLQVVEAAPDGAMRLARSRPV